MLKTGAQKQAAGRVLGVAVLSAFLVGSASGPLRSCLSHPGHASGTQQAAHTDTEAHHAPSPLSSAPNTSGHEGCSCLARCGLEQAPYLPGADVPVVAVDPPAPQVSGSPTGRLDVALDQLDLPLARPPPAVV